MNSIDNSRNYQGVAPTTTDSVAAESTLVPVQPEKPETNPEPVINTYEAFRQQGGERKGEQDLRGQLLQSSLHKQAGTTNTKSPARSRATSAAAPEGAPINHAKVARWQRGYLYDFGRPVTREQAAQWIFEGGKVPDKAKLVEGPGNTWHVQMPQELAGQIEVVKKMKHNILENSHEQINTKEITWVDGPPLPAVVNQRRDLKNDLGFKVAKHYNLDPGQYTTNQLASLTGKGHGYELQFDKPMTRDQIMQTLYEKNNMPNKGDVRLIPVGKEPSQT